MLIHCSLDKTVPFLLLKNNWNVHVVRFLHVVLNLLVNEQTGSGLGVLLFALYFLLNPLQEC